MGSWATASVFRLARDAYRRCETDEVRSGASPDAIVAVLMAVAAMEAFLSQAIDAAVIYGDSYPKLRNFVAVFKELDQKDTGGALKIKYNLARWMICDAPFDKGGKLFQEFSTLVDLRNALTHIKPDSIKATRTTKMLDKLQEWGLLASEIPLELMQLPPGVVINDVGHRFERRMHFSVFVSNRLVAKWACNTAVAMIQGFWNASTNKDVRTFFEFHANALHYQPIA